MFMANLFKAKLAELNKSVSEIAVIIGVNQATLHRKMNGKSDFTRNEIQLIRHALSLTNNEVCNIFFAEQLTKTQ